MAAARPSIDDETLSAAAVAAANLANSAAAGGGGLKRRAEELGPAASGGDKDILEFTPLGILAPFLRLRFSHAAIASFYALTAVSLSCAGSGNEVGRSCHIIRFKGKTIMVGVRCSLSSVMRSSPALIGPTQLDCGIHPAYSGISALPYFDEIEPSEIDILLISHFHLDHAGIFIGCSNAVPLPWIRQFRVVAVGVAALPYFLEKVRSRPSLFHSDSVSLCLDWFQRPRVYDPSDA